MTNLLIVGDSLSSSIRWPPYVSTRYTTELAQSAGGTTLGFSTDSGGELAGVAMTPDVITVYFGVNDSSSYDQDDFYTYTNTLIDDQLLTLWPDAEICLVMNGPTGNLVAPRDERIYHYREQYMTIHNDRSLRCPLVDLLGDVVYPVGWSAADQVHPSGATVLSRIADAITASLDTVFYRPRPAYQDVISYALFGVNPQTPWSGTEVNNGSTGGTTVTHTLDYARHHLILYNDGANDLDYRFSTTGAWATLASGDPPVEIATRHVRVILDAAANDVAYRAISVG